MVPLINSRHELIISQIYPTLVEVDDISLRTSPETSTRLIKAIEPVDNGSDWQQSRFNRRVDRLRPCVRHRRLSGRN